MTPGGGKKANAAEIARNGHIAAAIRGFLKKSAMSIGDLNQALGNERGNPAPYHWLSARGAPAVKYREKLAAVTGIPEADLAPRAGVVREAPRAVVEVGSVAHGAVVSTKRTEVLSFSVDDEGRARIKLDVTMPVTDASPLLRMLLDAGCVMGRVDDDGA